MFRTLRQYATVSFTVLLLTGGFVTLRSQTAVDGAEAGLVTLAANTRPEANAQNDLGEVSDDLSIDHMMLQLKRSPRQEQAVERFIAELHDPKSPNFHKWLTASDFGKTWGLAESDVRTIATWLESQGFTVNSVYPNAMVIDFSGNAGQVRRAFHTSIHNLSVNGVHHIANFNDPRIPAALAPAVAGIVSLHDFRPHNMSRRAKVQTETRAQYTAANGGQPYNAVAPPDLATIYDLNPLFAKGITGKGQTIAVIEDSDLFRTSDWTTFRSTFGLSQYTSGSLATVQPAPASGINSCSDPGVTGDDAEATLDAEWSTAAAPGAAIVVASCADTNATSGLFIALQNLVNESNPPAIVSFSYGGCEAENGAALNASTSALYQQAVTEGISVFVAAGDEGAASCDAGFVSATHGIGVNANASTPYNVAVGGTDFSDVFSGTAGTYWSAANTATWGSALSYIPEIPWNDSCAGSLLSAYMGFPSVYGAGGFCASDAAKNGGFVVVAASGGGPSNCATGVPATYGVSDGTCAGFPKPAWQTGVSGIPKDGVRDLPDVSMFAADNAAWGHYAIVCFSDPGNGGSRCTGDPGNWSGFGGTSVASPIMAGTQALVNQNAGGPQGNPNVVYYALAAGTPGVFHTIAQGDIDVNCYGARNCYGVIGTVDYGRDGRVFDTTWGGALSVSDTSFTPAYSAGASWTFANGLGSVDVNNLVMSWGAAQKP